MMCGSSELVESAGLVGVGVGCELRLVLCSNNVAKLGIGDSRVYVSGQMRLTLSQICAKASPS